MKTNPLDLLVRYPLFAVLDADRLRAWVESGHRSETRVGSTLLRQGEACRHVFLLLDGRVRISRADDSGRDRSVGFLGAGAVFGEYGLLPPHRNTATGRVVEEGEVLVLPFEPLRSAVAASPVRDGRLKKWLTLHALVNHYFHDSGVAFQTGPSLVRLIELCEELRVPAGQVLRTDGLLDDGWIAIRRGEAVVEDRSAPRRLAAGDSVGAASLLGDVREPAVVAGTDLECLYVPREALHLAFSNDPDDEVQTRCGTPNSSGRAWEWYAQRGPLDCGLAALVMVARGQGHDLTIERVTTSALASLRETGASLSLLFDVAGSVGFDVGAIRVGADRLRFVRLPAIAHLRDGHYVALLEIKPNLRMVVGDPAVGLGEWSSSAFLERWSGHLLLISPKSDGPG